MRQEIALKLLKTGKNIFLTGQPGSGKTHTINEYVSWLRSQGVEPAITASTGIAATHIGGMTIHSWSGLGIKKMLIERDIEQLKESSSVRRRVCKANILIIDEVSMLEARTLDNVNIICKTLRDDQRPFGGLQLVLVGDFFQLPPVNNSNESTQFAYSSDAWAEAGLTVCYLSQQFRHEDESLAKVLTDIRQADKSLELIYKKLSECLLDDQSQTEFDQLTSRLFSHNIDVDRLNSDLLQQIEDEEQVFTMTGRGATGALSTLKRSCLSPEELKLKIGARVMFTKNNYERGYINGMLGEVVAWDEDGGWPVVRLINDEELVAYPDEWLVSDGSHTIARISQVPLRLAWAMTVHKSQGMTLDSAIVDLTTAFAYGQGYVALSRVKSFAGLKIIGLNKRALEVDPNVKFQDQVFKQASLNAEANLETITKADVELQIKKFVESCGANGKVKIRKDKTEKISTYETTLALLKENNYSVAKVAEIRNITLSTVYGHVEELYVKEKISETEVMKMVPTELVRSLPKIITAFNELDTDALSPVYKYFNGQFSYDELRLARLVKQTKG